MNSRNSTALNVLCSAALETVPIPAIVRSKAVPTTMATPAIVISAVPDPKMMFACSVTQELFSLLTVCTTRLDKVMMARWLFEWLIAHPFLFKMSHTLPAAVEKKIAEFRHFTSSFCLSDSNQIKEDIELCAEYHKLNVVMDMLEIALSM